MSLWLVNPGAKRDARGRFLKKGAARKARRKAVGVTVRKSTKQRKRRGAKMAARKRARNGRFTKRAAAPARRRRRRARSSAPVARRRRRARSSAPARRRRYRRNPPSARNIVKTLTDGAQGALAAIVGKAAARAIPAQVGLPTTGPVGLATQGAVAIVLGMVAQKVSPRHGPFVVAGALMGPMEQVIRDLNLPVISSALAAYPGYPALPSGNPALMPQGGRAGLAAYPGALDFAEQY